jgi:L-malate glycosyltransferase
MSGIHQFVPMLHRADAVGRHTLRLRDVMAGRGICSEIYVELTDPDTAEETRPFTSYAEEAEEGDVLVYQLATASGIAPWLLGRPERLVLNYHNVTPPEYYAPWDNGLARHQLRAQIELRELAPRTTLGIAVSAFNEAELRAAGVARTAVVPPAAMMPAGERNGPAQQHQEAHVRGSGPGARWMSIGRLAPNKTVECAVMALLVTRAHQDPAATLEVVGRPVVPSYTAALYRFVDEMGLRGAVRLTGALRDDDLVERMARADVLVVTSRHEGFGVPVLEAMALGLPVVANRAGALPETVGDGGLLVDTDDPWALAAAVARVRGDATLKSTLAAAGRRRLAELDLSSAAARAVDAIAALRA